jgi:serine/threonine protein phosphatase PrpC
VNTTVNTEVRDDDTLPSDLARSLGRSVRSWAIGDTSVSSWAAASETGSQRSHNEDAWGQYARSVFVVADGMGGRPGGAVAASVAVAALLDELGGVSSDDVSSGGARVDWPRVMHRVNEAVVAAGRLAGHEQVGAAVAVVCSIANRTVVAHAGDVRVYRLRDGAREAITSDHTVATELELAGLRPDDVPDARGRLGALSSFLGDGEAWRGFSVRMLEIRGGDRLVVCSDGVHRHVSADGWRAAAAAPSCQDLVDLLVTSVRRAGGPDDATALALRLGGVP